MDVKKVFSLLKKCYPNIQPFIRQNIAFIILTECVVLLSLAIPLIVRFLVDTICAYNRWDLLPTFILAMSVAICASRIFAFTTNVVYNAFTANIQERARESLFGCLIRKRLPFFINTGIGELVDRLMRSSEQLHTIPSIYLERLISSVFTILGVLCVLFSFNPLMASISLISMPLFIIIYEKTRKKFYKQVQMAREEFGELSEYYTHTLQNIFHIKNMVSESREKEISSQKNRKLKELGVQYAVTGAGVNTSAQIITQLNQLGLLILGSILIKEGKMTVGTLVAFYSYIEMLYSPLITIIQTMNEANSSLAGIERYLEFYNNDEAEDFNQDGFSHLISGDITFEHATFHYDNNCILDNVSFCIGSNEKILLSGRSGIGKSTIAVLLKKFYELENGAILIGGVDIKNIHLEALRKGIVYVSQDSYFYPETIRDNFKRVNSGITDEEIMDALGKAQILQDVLGAGKKGLDTTLEKNAIIFSGGQRKRLSIAMLFASDASIVILDEVFVGLDEETRNIVWIRMKCFLKNKTVIIIDHNFRDREYFSRIFELTEQHKIEEI